MNNKQIRLIEQGAFLGLSNLKELQLSWCLLSEMPPLAPVQSTLTHLILRANSLTEVRNDYFQGFTQLVSLDLTRNALSILPDLNPVAPTLRNLKVTSNQITSISPSMTNTIFPILYRLDLERNKVKQLDQTMLNCWPFLKYLNIGYNLIETLDDMSKVTRGSALKVC